MTTDTTPSPPPSLTPDPFRWNDDASTLELQEALAAAKARIIELEDEIATMRARA